MYILALLFLDEPTSGYEIWIGNSVSFTDCWISARLDAQSAFNVVRFLKKLAAAGQGQVRMLLLCHHKLNPCATLFFHRSMYVVPSLHILTDT